MRPRGASLSYFGAVALTAALGTWARCAEFARVFTADGVLLKPTDSHYYVRFAQLQLETFPAFTRFDALVNHPEGAWIIWPPVHTWWVALHVALSGGRPEAGAAFVGVSATLVWFAVLAVPLRRVVGTAKALGCLLLLALMPAMIEGSGIGNADHHVHEPWLVIALVLGMTALLDAPRVSTALWVGVLLGGSRLLTTQSVLLLPLVVLTLALGVRDRSYARKLAPIALFTGAAAVLAFSVSADLFGDPRALHYAALSGFLPMAAVVMFGSVGLVLGMRGGDVRYGWTALPVALAGVFIVRSVLEGTSALAGGDPLVQIVTESQPVWRLWKALPALLGPVLFALPFIPLGLWNKARHERGLLPSVGLLWVAALLAMFLLQVRFVHALAGALALTLPMALYQLLEQSAPRVRRAGHALIGLGVIALGITLVPASPHSVPTDESLLRSTFAWLRSNTPAAPTEGVVASHDVGHLVTLWGQRPAVATPFSQLPWHVAGNARGAAVLGACDDAAAFDAAKATRARYVVATEFWVILGHPPRDNAKTVAAWLLDHAGLQTDARAASAHFRLIYESPEQRSSGHGPAARIFEVVEGAVLTGRGPPGVPVKATFNLMGATGVPRTYVRTTEVRADGTFRLRVAYPSVPASAAQDAPRYEISIGEARDFVDVQESDVREGREVRIGGAAEAPVTAHGAERGG